MDFVRPVNWVISLSLPTCEQIIIHIHLTGVPGKFLHKSLLLLEIVLNLVASSESMATSIAQEIRLGITEWHSCLFAIGLSQLFTHSVKIRTS